MAAMSSVWWGIFPPRTTIRVALFCVQKFHGNCNKRAQDISRLHCSCITGSIAGTSEESLLAELKLVVEGYWVLQHTHPLKCLKCMRVYGREKVMVVAV